MRAASRRRGWRPLGAEQSGAWSRVRSVIALGSVLEARIPLALAVPGHQSRAAAGHLGSVLEGRIPLALGCGGDCRMSRNGSRNGPERPLPGTAPPRTAPEGIGSLNCERRPVTNDAGEQVGATWRRRSTKRRDEHRRHYRRMSPNAPSKCSLSPNAPWWSGFR